MTCPKCGHEMVYVAHYRVWRCTECEYEEDA
jgi:ribosomal protein L37AE/L43A